MAENDARYQKYWKPMIKAVRLATAEEMDERGIGPDVVPVIVLDDREGFVMADPEGNGGGWLSV